MIIQLVTIIIAFEMVDFLLGYILPKDKLKGAYENAINIIIFCGIIVIGVNIIKNADIGLLSYDRLISSNEVKLGNFDSYIEIYKQIIFDALE